MRRFFPQKHILIILFVSIALTLIWFRNGNVMGGGETGIPFYNLSQLVKISGWTWGTQALGNNDSLTVASGPFLRFFSIFQNIGIPGFALQAIFYFAILFFTLYSIYFLTDTLFPAMPSLFKCFSSFFYLFNLYSVMNIWNRNLPNTIVFYAILPLLLALYIRGLKSKQYIYALLVTVITAILSYAFGAPAQTVIFWLVLLATSIYYFLFMGTGKFTFKYFLIHLPLWIIFNFFWISQEAYYRISSAFSVNAESFFSDSGNKYTFDVLSQQLGQLNNLFLLKHGTFFTKNSIDLPFSWPLVYSQPIALAVQWVVILLILIVAVKKIKEKAVGFLLTFFIVGIFAAKGNSDPLGDIFDFLFQKISLLEFFRNPFEKLGFLIPLSLAPLFALAVYDIKVYLSKKSKALSIFSSSFFLLYAFLFIGIIFWTTLIFTSSNPPTNDLRIGYEVRPPDYYKQADKWLTSQDNMNRMITFPLGGEGIFNKWPKGYAGIELSGVLFNTSGVTYITTIPYFYEVAQKLEKLFITRVDFYKIASLLNAKYLILRPDINEDVAVMRSESTIRKVLDERSASDSAKLKLAKSFDPLKIYSYSGDVILPKIYPSSKMITTNKLGDMEDYFTGFGDKNDVIVYAKDKKLPFNQDSGVQTKASIIHTSAKFSFIGPNELPFSQEPNILPYSGNLPNNLFYPLISLREKFSLLSIQDKEKKAEYEILLLGKRMVEAQKALEAKDSNQAINALSLYNQDFPKTFSSIQTLPAGLNRDLKIWKPEYLTLAFGTHLSLLNAFEKVTLKDSLLFQQIESTKKIIRDKLVDAKILPKYPPATDADFPISNRFDYQYSVDQEGEYEIILPEFNLKHYFNFPPEMTLQIDDKVVKRKIILTSEGTVNLGKINFTAGLHEIGFNLPEGINLVDNQDQIQISAEHDDQKQEAALPIQNFDPYSTYFISFDYYVRSGAQPKVSLLQNNDKLVNGKRVPRADHIGLLPVDNYWFDYRKYAIIVAPDPTADSALIYFSVDPWNDCDQIFNQGLKHLKCNDPEFKKLFDRTSEVHFKNIKVTKSFLDDPLLRKVVDVVSTSSLPMIEFTKIDQTKYLVSIKNAKNPFLLVFSELFNADWRVYPVDNLEEIRNIWVTWGRKSILSDKHLLVNGYANGWYIDQKGDYNLILEYWPQRLLYIGFFISGISLVLCLGTIVWIKKRRSNETSN